MESEAIAEIRRTIIKPKRRYGRQINAENCKGGSENYFRSLIFVPY